jgi:hypothetical protein
LFIIALLVILSTLQPIAWTPPILWTHQLGNPKLTSGINSISSDNSGIYTAGFLNQNLTIGNLTFGSPFLTSYGNNGNTVWTRNIGNSSSFSPKVTIGSDGLYVEIGYGKGETLLKYDFSGTELWDESIQPPVVMEPSSPITDGVIGAGVSSVPLTNQNLTGNVLFLREYDSNGRILWTKEFYNSSDISSTNAIQGVSVSSNETFVLTPQFLAAFNLSGKELWTREFNFTGIVTPLSLSSDDSGVYVTGTIQNTPTNPGIGFISKYDFTGSMIWNSPFAPPDYGGVSTSGATANGSGAYVSISSGAGNDFVVRYDSAGHEIWTIQTTFKSSGNNFLIVSGSTGFYIAGAIGLSPRIQAIVQDISGDSSLILLGVNPPFSFVLAASIVAITGLSIFYLLRRAARRASRPKPAPRRF